MTVDSVLVNGRPASFTFVQPTYPGNPNGQNDPDPRAHEAGELTPVGGPESNPFPPAYSPELLSTNPNKQTSLDGTQCPANKLVITPSSPMISSRSSHFVATATSCETGERRKPFALRSSSGRRSASGRS